ncbi:hypothetical protein Fmac_027561 [Flemingia macrophylla]|uniref:GS catalytic domain-containing protein n=1 Tax=Flemingia macrophylla TaxID=520843 RepID=A0ABD1LI41_9FABA
MLTSFGDRDLDLRLSNPLLLRAVLEDKRYSKSRIVLLHASYPFSREASYLASVYSQANILELSGLVHCQLTHLLLQVYLDFGLAIPKLSVHGMISSMKELLELAPINKAIPKKRLNEIVAKNGVALSFVTMGFPSHVDGPADGSGLTAVGEARLMPDLSTIKRIPWEGKDEWVPFDSSPYCSSSAFDAASPVLREVAAALQSLGISVEQIHAEGGKGQFELILKYTICTKAADNLVYTREVIRAIARKHGLLATFIPKYALDDMGSGSHVHLSLWRNGQNVFMASDRSSKHGISAMGKEFMAGILHHLPSILAFIAPLPNSYDRLQPNTCSGAYLFWGNENKEAPLRASSPPGTPDGLVSNFEIKSFDGSANPYLGLAAILAAGIDGLRRHLPLPEPVDTDPNPNVLQRLPASLSESLDALHKDDLFKEFISDKWLTAIKAIRKADIDYCTKHKDACKLLIHRF